MEIDLQLFISGEQTIDFVKHGEWKVLEFVGERHFKIYNCCPEPYYTITYTLRIKRKIMYYLFNLIVPCALIGKFGIDFLKSLYSIQGSQMCKLVKHVSAG